MLNFVSSAFHAVKITFANEIGNLCATHGIDGQEVMEYFCLDRELNISSAFLRPGFAFGGRRLSRDLRAVLHRAKEQEVDCPLLSAVLPSNQVQISRAIELVEKTRRSKIGILGIGFRGGMPDFQENPVIHLAQALAGKGYRVRIFDEGTSPQAAAKIDSGVHDFPEQDNVDKFFSPCLQELIQDSEVVVLASRNTAVRNLPALLSDRHILIDLAGVAREFTVTPSRKCASF
jgi:GDP-mannose 6-dehydrogenase